MHGGTGQKKQYASGNNTLGRGIKINFMCMPKTISCHFLFNITVPLILSVLQSCWFGVRKRHPFCEKHAAEPRGSPEHQRSGLVKQNPMFVVCMIYMMFRNTNCDLTTKILL